MLEESVSDHLERALFSWPERVCGLDRQGLLSRQDTVVHTISV